MRFANVVSLLALFLSLGGVSYAVTQIDDNSVSARHVVNGSLTGTDVKNSTITGSDIKDGSITAVDVLGHLPGITYFKYRDTKGPFNSAATQPIITDKVAKGVYFVQGEVLAEGTKGSGYELLCRIEYGTTPRPAAYGQQSGVFPGATLGGGPPGATLSLSGVFEATADDTPVILRCAGLALTHYNSRLEAIELRDLQIESEG